MVSTAWNPNPKVVAQANANGLLKQELQIATANQRSFVLTSFAFVVNTGSLVVFKNGKPLARNRDYAEVSGSEILMAAPCTVGDEIMLWGFVGISGTAYDDSALRNDLGGANGASIVKYGTDNVQSVLDSLKLANYAALRAYTGKQTSVYIVGKSATVNTPNIAGTFVLDAADATSADNSGTVIVDVQGRRWKRVIEDSVHIDWFGAIPDARLANGTLNPAPTNSQPALQAAIKYAVINGITKVTANPNGSYYCADVTYVPALYNNNAGYPNRYSTLIMDFNGAEFVGKGSASNLPGWIESGYFDASGNILSSFRPDIEDEKYLFNNYTLKNAQLENFSRGIRIKNWVYGCNVTDIQMETVGQALVSDRSFYCNFERINNRGAVDASNDNLANYEVADNNNIMPLKACVTSGHKIGYKLTGGSEAMRLVDCGIEGCSTVGVIVNGPYNIKFDSCYFEANGLGVRADQGVNSVTFDNCWGYGNFAMFYTASDNANIYVLPNNILGNGCRWFDNTLPVYNLSKVQLKNDILPAGTAIANYTAPPAVDIDQKITIFDSSVGLATVLGRAMITSKHHAGKYSGRFGNGFTIKDKMIGTVMSFDAGAAGSQTVHWLTSIDYTTTMCAFVALKVDHNLGTWRFFGWAIDNKLVPIWESEARAVNASVLNTGGKLEITCPFPWAAGNVGAYSGEIRLIG